LLPIGIIQFPLEIGLFSGKQDHSSGKSYYFPENSIIFPEKRAVATGSYLIPIGNGAISWRKEPFFRETDHLPNEKHHFLLEIYPF
ncbi:MAG TPA: hypothetical protein VIM79_06870, partial [Niastella sp.]